MFMAEISGKNKNFPRVKSYGIPGKPGSPALPVIKP